MDTLEDALTILALFWKVLGVKCIASQKKLQYEEIYKRLTERFPSMTEYSQAFKEIPENYKQDATYSLRNFMPGNTMVTFSPKDCDLIYTVWRIIYE